jgi:enamine deaminase RidA (YjgF/YER057c/UK114 family)
MNAPAPLPGATPASREVVAPGRMVFLSGQVAFDERREVVGAGDFEAQMRFVFAQLTTVLNSHDLGPESVVSLRTYLTRTQDVAAYRNLRSTIAAELWGDGAAPTNTLLVVQQLVDPRLLIEVEAVAVS